MEKPTDTLENHPTQTLAEGDELKTCAVAICGDNATLPAKFVGCGQPIATIEELYRCTHCSVPFHLDCAEHHFKDSTVLTLQMVEEIERESLPHTGVLPMTTEQPAQTLAEGDELKTCDWCGATPIRANLDGDDLCQTCCDAWARGEGIAEMEASHG